MPRPLSKPIAETTIICYRSITWTWYIKGSWFPAALGFHDPVYGSTIDNFGYPKTGSGSLEIDEINLSFDLIADDQDPNPPRCC